ncbi:MAG: hypothetical protein P1V20_07055 [Verrucomicrobiales bacterium]|nr:hypothetical protein [Verrucomicrobiales bacterium]
MKIDLDSETQKSLELEAIRKGVEVEDLAAQLVARALSTEQHAPNIRREELLRKKNLSSAEREELDQLQLEADQKLEQLDLERRDEVERMEKEVEAILNS